ncbi:hypothetical protein Q4E40_08595 [Pontibacter sp. BT731]|uniref:hypothetical protein n=1 Tax=Pontibacter coccineus TaxID=3063328 RepID=UPI0026E17D23|nr:hypothetical protein [Pontibacter sp. BT731]MDO6390182.1 hypothetical protein [Pontibacter sp. BT731]
MTTAIITNTTFRIILLAWVTLNIVAGLYILTMDFDLISLGSLAINSAILFCYFTKSLYLKQAVKIGAIVLLAPSLFALLPAVALGLLYGMGMIWKYIPLLVIMPLVGFYLYKGSGRYIRLTESNGNILEV